MDDLTPEEGLLIAARIRHILGMYPKISYSMLQIALGTNTRSDQWRPVLDIMVEEKEVVLETVTSVTPTKRQHSYTIIQLAE